MALYLSEIVSVSGKPGLQKVIGRRTTGLIVENLDEQGKRFATNLNHKVSFLSDISMYTYDGDENLANVLKSLHEKVEKDGLSLVDKKNSSDEINAFFRQVLENFDEDQVYKSDILKLVSWYGILKDKVDFNKLIDESDTESVDKQVAKQEDKSKKPAKTNQNQSKAQSKAKGGNKKAGNIKAG